MSGILQLILSFCELEARARAQPAHLRPPLATALSLPERASDPQSILLVLGKKSSEKVSMPMPRPCRAAQGAKRHVRRRAQARAR